jgi:hypothetical protein
MAVAVFRVVMPRCPVGDDNGYVQEPADSIFRTEE